MSNNTKQLPPGPELDAKVADALPNIELGQNPYTRDLLWKDLNTHEIYHSPPPFSTDGNWMLKALDWLKNKGFSRISRRDLEDMDIFRFEHPVPINSLLIIQFTDCAENWPHAVALAVVEAKERMEKE